MREELPDVLAHLSDYLVSLEVALLITGELPALGLSYKEYEARSRVIL